MEKWYTDQRLLDRLPLRYRAYAAYSRAVGSTTPRRVPGGSALLRALRIAGRAAKMNSVVEIQGPGADRLVADFDDDRILGVIHEIRRENPEFPVMSTLLPAGATFIDVGANYGTFSIVASRLVGEGGTVIAIEPQPRLAGFIEDSARLSGIKNIQVMPAAAGAGGGTDTLLVPAGDTGRAGVMSRFSGSGPHSRIQVSTTRLDDLSGNISAISPLVIKIDVEGSEMNVLEGARSLIPAFRPPLIIELNPWSADASGNSVDDILATLKELGYRWFSLAQEFPRSLEHAAIPRNTQENLVAGFERLA